MNINHSRKFNPSPSPSHPLSWFLPVVNRLQLLNSCPSKHIFLLRQQIWRLDTKLWDFQCWFFFLILSWNTQHFLMEHWLVSPKEKGDRKKVELKNSGKKLTRSKSLVKSECLKYDSLLNHVLVYLTWSLVLNELPLSSVELLPVEAFFKKGSVWNPDLVFESEKSHS